MIEKLKDAGIIPDLIDLPKGKIGFLRVIYPNAITLDGQELTPTQVKDEPEIEMPEGEGFYTLLMADPDAPSRYHPHSDAILHYWVANIPGGGRVKDGTVLVTYMGSGAPEGTGLHRYVFMLFRQAEFIDTEGIVPIGLTTQGRRGKRHLAIIREYALELAAAAYFEAQYDAYVKELRRRLNLPD